MSFPRTSFVVVALIVAHVSGVVMGQTEKFELIGNVKVFGAGNGIIFPDGTKQTTAAASPATDLVCAGCVGSADVGTKAIRLSNLNATVFMNYTLDLFGTINNGSCSNFSGQSTPGVAANSYVLVFGVRPASGAANTGWVMEGEDTPTGVADTVKVRVCNFTGANADPPNLRFNFWTVAQ